MIITIDKIKSLDPCQSGIENFESKYPKYKNTLGHLLSLGDISYSDKIWLAAKVLDKMTLVQWSLDCATLVAENFNKQYPEDNRINDCLEVVKKYINGECDESAAGSAARLAVWSAVRSAAGSAARLAAGSAVWSAESAARLAVRSAAGSAESAAGSAESAAGSAARLAVWSAVWSAAGSAARLAEKEQEDLNLSLLIALVENL